MNSNEKVLIRLISNTKRLRRQNSILEIASDIEFLKKEYGSLKKLSELVGISAGMLNKFLAVEKLSPTVQQFVQSRQVDSVETVFQLAKFPKPEQEKLANLFMAGKINSQDIRLIHPLKKAYPDKSADELAKMVLESKNRKISVINFDKSNLKSSLTAVENKFKITIGVDGFLGIELINGKGKIRLSKEGEIALRRIAKENNKTLKEFVLNLL